MANPKSVAYVWVIGVVALVAIVAVGGYYYYSDVVSGLISGHGSAPGGGPPTEADKAATEMQKEIARVYGSLNDEAGVPTAVEQRADTQPVATGEFGEMERFLKTAMNRAVAQRNEYLGELQKIGWMRVLDPKRIEKDPASEEGRRIVAQAHEVIDLYQRKNVALMGELRASIGSLDVSDASRRQMLSGFESGLQRSGQEELWKLERQVVREVEGMLDVLADGGWEVTGDELLFSDDARLATYQAHLETINGLVAQQTALQKRAMTRATDQLETVKRAQ